MRYSAVHPPSSTVALASHTASQDRSSCSVPPEPMDFTASRCTPAGLWATAQAVREGGVVGVVGVARAAEPVRVHEVHVPTAQALGGLLAVLEADADVEGL